MWNAGDLQPHLDTRQGANNRQIIRVAKMTDTEHLAGELCQAGAKRDIEISERRVTERVGIVTGWYENRRQRRGIVLWLSTPDFQSPRAHGAPGCLGKPIVTRKDIL